MNGCIRGQKVMSKLTIRNLDDMSVSFPWFMQATRVLQPKLITNGQTDFTAFQLREAKPCNTFLIKPQVPTHGDVCLRLRFLESFVVISFNLDERAEDVLVLISILISQDDRLRFVVYTGFLQILQRCTSVFAPQVFESVYLLERYLAGSQLLGFAGRFDKP